LGEIGSLVVALTTIHCDIQSVIWVVDNLVAHSKVKQVEIHVFYLRQLVHEKVVTLVYCKTNDNIVDIFTKSLYEANFVKLHNMLGLQAVEIMGDLQNFVLVRRGGGFWNLRF
jgi:hypothetical protein